MKPHSRSLEQTKGTSRRPHEDPMIDFGGCSKVSSGKNFGTQWKFSHLDLLELLPKNEPHL